MVPKKGAPKKKPSQDDSSEHEWEHESRDQMSALIDKLRELPRHTPTDTRPDGIYVLAVDLDAAITASIEVPHDADESKDSDR